MVECHNLRTINEFGPREFENFTYDLLRVRGFDNLVWRTPGSDEGRDIEASLTVSDASGYRHSEKWYVECKRYASSIPWPVVWEKLSFADLHNADFLLISTNSNPSPQCESQIIQWNEQGRKPKIRIWRYYDLEALSRLHRDIATKYGLKESPSNYDRDLGPLSVALTKAVQASYTGLFFGADPHRAIEAAAALSELLSLRMEQLQKFDTFAGYYHKAGDTLYPWVSCECDISDFDMPSLRVVCSSLRFMLSWDRATLHQDGAFLALSGVGGKSRAVPDRVWAAMAGLEPWLHLCLRRPTSGDANNSSVLIQERSYE